jgi:hypothetical protein
MEVTNPRNKKVVIYIMKQDPGKKSDEETVRPDSPGGDEVPARGMSDELVNGETIDIPEKNNKTSEDLAE